MFNLSRYTDAQARLLSRAERLGVYDPTQNAGDLSEEEEADLVQQRGGRGAVGGEHVIDMPGGDGDGVGGDGMPVDDAYQFDYLLGIQPGERTEREVQLRLEAKRHARFTKSLVSRERDEMAARFLEEEGIYVAPRPDVPIWNLRKYVARLEREGGDRLAYFEEDMRVKLLPDPLTHTVLRPSVRGDVYVDSAALKTSTTTPTLHTGRETYFDFNIRLHSVEFHDHELFSLEDRLCAELRESYDEFKRRQTVNLVKYYEDKIVAFQREAEKLRGELDALQHQSRTPRSRGGRSPRPGADTEGPSAEALRKRLLAVLEQAVEARELKDEEEKELHTSFSYLYKLWRRIQEWRETRTLEMRQAGYRLTDVSHRMDDDEDDDNEDEDEDGGSEASERDSQQSNGGRDKKHRKRKKKKKKKHKQIGGGGSKKGDGNVVFVGNPLRLRVIRTRTDVVADEQQLRRSMDDELAERREIYELHGQLRTGKFSLDGTGTIGPGGSRLRASVSSASLHRREKQKHTKKLLRHSSGITRAEDDELSDSTDTTVEEEEQNLVSFDERAEAKRIERRINASRRKPGYPIYNPLLVREYPLTPYEQCTPAERSRRDKVSHLPIRVAVYVNDALVTRLETRTLVFPTFSVLLAERVPLRVLAVPRSIRCDVVAEGMFVDKVLAQVFLPVPDYGTAVSESSYHFIGEQFAASRSNPDAEALADLGPRRITGVMNALLEWGAADSQHPDHAHYQQAGGFGTAPPVPSPGAGGDEPEARSQRKVPPSGVTLNPFKPTRGKPAAMGTRRARLVSAQQAQRSQHANLDPNDPRNAALLELMRRAALASERGRVLRAQRFRSELAIVDVAKSSESIKEHKRRSKEAAGPITPVVVESARKKLLRARNRSPMIRDAVPLHDEQIPSELFKLIHPQQSLKLPPVAEMAVASREGGGGDDDMVDWEAVKEWHRFEAQSKLMSLRKDVHDVGEVVREGALPDFAVNFNLLNNCFQPRRKLRVLREDPQPVANPQMCRLVIQVVRAMNLPCRSHGFDLGGDKPRGAEEDDADLLVANLDDAPLRPFVEIEFQDKYKTTSIASGADPSWDELITMDFHPPGGSFSPAVLEQVRDVISLNVFDEVTFSYKDYRSDHTQVQQTERRFLGRVEIPFTTVHMNGAVDGQFVMEVPLLHLGYRRQKPGVTTMLYLYATLDPRLPTPPQSIDYSEWRDMSPFYEHCISWQEHFRDSHPRSKGRNVKTLVGDINGEPVLVCRFVRPQTPPDGMDRQLVPRFVSRVPFVDDWQASAGVYDVWCTSNEFLTLVAGDWEEHALLLCNYFKWFDKNTGAAGAGWHTYVVLGRGIPEGDTAYVLRLHEKDRIIDQEMLWNAVTGLSYDLRNEFEAETCPLVSVGCVFDEESLYVNIQGAEHPARVSYYFENKEQWAPLFNNTYSQHRYLQSSVQVDIRYFHRHDQYYLDRANKIERLIERKIEEWRRFPTRWNFGVCHTLREALQSFEDACYDGGSTHSLEDSAEIVKLKQIYDGMYGFPLNFADGGDDAFVENSDSNPIIKAVRNSKIHEVESETAVFALGVHIHPYPNSIGSIWVYVAVLNKDDEML